MENVHSVDNPNSVDTSKEERAIEELNQAEASQNFHLFSRSCTVLGYGVYLALVTCFCLTLVSLTNASSQFYDNGLPKMNNYKEYFLYFGGAFISLALAWVCQNYASRIHSFARKGLGYGSKFMKAFSIYVVVILILIGFFVFLLETVGMNPIATEILLLFSVLVAFFFIIVLWLFVIAILPQNMVVKKAPSEKEKKNEIKISYVIIVGLPIVLMPFYYMYISINFYRISSEFWKFFMCLIFHFFFTEFYLTYFKMRICNVPDEHPFFIHSTAFCIEGLLNLFRRFLFNDTNNSNLMVYFTIICGIQEIISRNYMEYKERMMYKILGKEFPTDKTLLIRRRKFLGYSVTSRSIQEIASILVAPMMLSMFQGNRFGVDLGYDGEIAVDIQTLMTGTLFQLIVELLVIYVCSVLEVNNKIPMSDFFFQHRSFSMFGAHIFHFLFSSLWVLHSFRTSPNSLLCHDPTNICTCPSFKVYQARCQEILLNSTASSTDMIVQPSSSFSSFFSDAPSIILSILGILFIIGISVFFYFRNKSLNVINKSLKIREDKFKIILDAATLNLMEKSALQQAITTIESMCRGVSPSQAKLLKNIIEILKSQSKVNNVVDVSSMLTESSDDVDVRNWLRGQLMTHEDILSNPIHPLGSKKYVPSSSSRQTLGLLDLGRVRKSISMTHTNKLNLQLELLENDHDKDKISNEINNVVSEESENMESESNGIFFDYNDRESDNFLSWDFNVFAIKNKSPQAWLAFCCLTRINLIQELKLPKLQLSNMLLFVEQNYSLFNYDDFSAYSSSHTMTSSFPSTKNEAYIHNLYHNNLHGADVFQGVLYFATTYVDIGGVFSSFDLFSLLFAAYIHDFNHPGLNSTYVIADWPFSGISSTFGTESPLEKHHLAMAFNLMRNVEEYNFLFSFKTSDLNYFRRIVTECVLATDLAKSMSWLSTARITVKDKLKELENPLAECVIDDPLQGKADLEYKILLMQLSIKCADVGHPARSLDLHLEWSDRIREEFYCQGDKEKGKGMSISPLCDRNISMTHYPQGQIGFINYVCKPLFILMNEACWSTFKPEDKPWINHIQNNIRFWEEKKNEINNQNISTV